MQESPSMIPAPKTSPLNRLLSVRWLAEVMAVLGGIWFLIQTIIYALTQESILDEGAYLYKGYLFATGQYVPYQAYGPWTNHMPLSFMIPGWIQLILGPGLRTGRYFAIAMAGLLLIGYTTRRRNRID